MTTTTHSGAIAAYSKTKTFPKVAAAFAMIMMISAIPATASARGSVHIDLPHFTLGYHDEGYRSHRSHKRKHYRKNRRHNRYYNRHYNSHRNYDRNGYSRYNNNQRYYNDGYYTSNRYDRRNRNYNRSRSRDNYCPTPGYSSRYYRNGGCYSHGDHYHCEG